MGLLLWSALLMGAIFAAHWGADRLSVPLQKLRTRWGFSEAAGAAFVALATASPEIGTNSASALKGLSDIGLGNLLGSNIISVPAIVGVAYLASQTQSPQDSMNGYKGPRSPRSTSRLTRVDSWRALRVKPEALTIQAIPYLAVIALAAILTIPPSWRGLQPIDGWIMLAAYGIYVGQALGRKRQPPQPVKWHPPELWGAIGGMLALAIGAYLIVVATENIVAILGISELIGGLLITSTLSIAPEVFATWSIARSGQVTAATTSVIADNIATMTLAFFPLALVNVPIQDGRLFAVNLFFVALLGGVYAAFIQWGQQDNSFELWEVGVLVGLYGVYLAVMLLFVL
ncbi:MAG: sodium:calcium antiporter [Leptolyngbyaceae cyanobacterium]